VGGNFEVTPPPRQKNLSFLQELHPGSRVSFRNFCSDLDHKNSERNQSIMSELYNDIGDAFEDWVESHTDRFAEQEKRKAKGEEVKEPVYSVRLTTGGTQIFDDFNDYCHRKQDSDSFLSMANSKLYPPGNEYHRQATLHLGQKVPKKVANSWKKQPPVNCKFFLRGTCTKGSSCAYAHTGKHQIPCKFGKTCVNMSSGKCIYQH
jgi:hypothetical protein